MATGFKALASAFHQARTKVTLSKSPLKIPELHFYLQSPCAKELIYKKSS